MFYPLLFFFFLISEWTGPSAFDIHGQSGVLIVVFLSYPPIYLLLADSNVLTVSFHHWLLHNFRIQVLLLLNHSAGSWTLRKLKLCFTNWIVGIYHIYLQYILDKTLCILTKCYIMWIVDICCLCILYIYIFFLSLHLYYHGCIVRIMDWTFGYQTSRSWLSIYRHISFL